MNKSEFTNVKKLQDAFPSFLLLQGRAETQEYKKKNIPSWNGKLCLHFFLSLEADLGNKGLHLGVVIFANISYVPKSEMNNFNRPVPNYTSAASQKETKN